MIAKMDYFDFHSSNPDSVAARFGAKQVEEMAKGSLIVTFAVHALALPLYCDVLVVMM